MRRVEIYCDKNGQWWVSVPLDDGGYAPTHDLRKRTRVPVERNAPREEAEKAARRLVEEEL